MAGKTGQILTPAQERALVRLLAGATDEAAARAARVSRQTVSAWRNHHVRFADELRTRQAEVFSAAVRRLAAGLERAAIAMIRLTSSKDEGTRLRACLATFEMFLKAKDISEFDSRLTALETELFGAKGDAEKETA